MNYIELRERYGTLAYDVLPEAPFPRKHVLGVFVDAQDAKEAADALRDAGFGEEDLHVMGSRDFVDVVGRDHSPFNVVTSTSYDMYLLEAKRGRSFLAVRPTSTAQLMQIRDLLAPHGAYFVKYIDTWAMSEVLP